MKIRAALILALAAVLFSTSGLFIKLTTVSPLYLFGLRSMIAAVTLTFFVGRLKRPRTSYQLGGMFALAGTQLFFVLATRETTAANAIFIQYTAPIFVAFFGVWYLGEPFRKPDRWAMGAILLGLFIFLYDDFSLAGSADLFLNEGGLWGGLKGFFFAMLSGLCLAWFVLFMRRAKDESPLDIALWGNIFGGVVLLPLLLTTPLPSWGDLGAITFLGVFQIGLGLVLLSIAIKQLTAIETILIQSLEPILNPIWVFLLIGEEPTRLSLMGGAIVLAAVTWRTINQTTEIRHQTSDIRQQTADNRHQTADNRRWTTEDRQQASDDPW